MADESDEILKNVYDEIDRVCLANSDRILSAFIENKVSYTDFADINGYGNYDTGRDKLEKIFATVLGCEDALVRPQIMSGTNALFLAFSALLKHGDTMISLTGTPYDSLQEMIGLYGESSQSLKKAGVRYEQIDLVNNEFDEEAIVGRLRKNDVKLVEIQRSRGYSARKSLTISQISRLVSRIREVNTEVIINRCRAIQYTDAQLYGYRRHQQSMMAQLDKIGKKYVDRCYTLYYINEHILPKDNSYARGLNLWYLHYRLLHSRYIVKQHCTENCEEYRYAQQVVKDLRKKTLKEFLANKYVPLGKKITYPLYEAFPKLYSLKLFIDYYLFHKWS